VKVLVAIANYGASKGQHVQTLIDTYQGFERHDADIVILSNVEKDFGPGVEVAVGLPIANPWSLPFAHRQIFADRQDDYDLFIYSEDDTLILEDHLGRYLAADEVLPEDHIAGFMRHEIDSDGAWHYSTVHAAYHWDPASVLVAGGETYANFTNVHSAAYILSRGKLKRCIASGGFLVPPHEGRYDMLCSAATDPYTRCGLKKAINVDRLAEFSLHHLPNKYIGRIGLPRAEMDLQLETLRAIPNTPRLRKSLLEGEARVSHSGRYDRSYFTPEVSSVLPAMPGRRCKVLSVGCDMGRTEAALLALGHEVEAIPLDHVVAQSARARGVTILDADLDDPAAGLPRGHYDVLLMNFCLPYIRDPAEYLRAFAPVLAEGGQVVVPYWNWAARSERRKRQAEEAVAGPLSVGDFDRSGIHRTDPRIVRGWLKEAGYRVEASHFDVPARGERFSKLSLGLIDRHIAVTGAMRGSPAR